eukprot:6204665-Pleurochrysis_carterae.AAC.2
MESLQRRCAKDIYRFCLPLRVVQNRRVNTLYRHFLSTTAMRATASLYAPALGTSLGTVSTRLCSTSNLQLAQ